MKKQRVSEDKIIPRGDVVSAGPTLVSAAKTISREFEKDGCEVKEGLMISGEKLVDNKTFRDELKKQNPDALGGEMEATGIRDVAYREKAE